MIDLPPCARSGSTRPRAGRTSGRRAARRAGPRGAAARSGDDGRQRLAHRRRRVDARRRHGLAGAAVGLACDNVVSYRVVTADGRVLGRAATSTRTCTGGCAAAAATSAWWSSSSSACTPSARARSSSSTRSARDDAAAARCAAGATWRPGAPRPATFTASVCDGQATVGFVWVGDPQRGRRLAAAFDAVGEPLTRHVAETSYLHLQSRDDSPRATPAAATGRATTYPPCPTPRSTRCSCAARGPPEREPPRGAAPSPTCRTTSPRSAIAQRRSTTWRPRAGPTRGGRRADGRRPPLRRCDGPFADGAYVNALSDDGAEGRAPRVPGGASSPARRGQGRLRPGQRLPPQREHQHRAVSASGKPPEGPANSDR